jgi:hypothetical protein
MTNDSVTLTDGTVTRTIRRDTDKGREICKIIASDPEADLSMFLKPEKASAILPHTISTSGGVVSVQGYDINCTLLARYLEELIDTPGLPIEHVRRFVTRLSINQHQVARNTLFNFIVAGGLHIDQYGNIVAYKAVKEDLRDKHTGRVQYELGKKIYAPEGVDLDPGVSCSTGLHVGTFEYANNFARGSDVVLEVQVAPEDVGVVPNGEPEKIRAFALTPIRVIEANRKKVDKVESYDNPIEQEKVAIDIPKEIERKIISKEECDQLTEGLEPLQELPPHLVQYKDMVTVYETPEYYVVINNSGAGILRLSKPQDEKTVVIGRYDYTVTQFDKEPKLDDYKKVTRSDHPKYFKENRQGCNLWRQQHTQDVVPRKYSNYIEELDNVWTYYELKK